MNIFQKIVSLLVGLGLVLGNVQQVNAETNDNTSTYLFTIVSEVFEHGTDITKVVIYSDIEVESTEIDVDTFKVHALHTSTIPNVEQPIVFDDQRLIVDAYVSDQEDGQAKEQGHYIVLELDSGYQVSESSYLQYDMASGRNYPLDLEYIITQEKDYNNVETLVVKENTEYQLKQFRTLLEEDFEYKTSTSGLSYRQYTPDLNTDESKPLIIWLHGAGEGGTNNQNQLLGNQGGVAFINNEAQTIFGDAYVIAPQCPTAWMTFIEGTTTSIYQEDLISLIKQVIQENPSIDRQRVYIGGCSMGGYMTWQALIAAPELFAAAFPICAAYTPTDEDIEKVKDIPMWIVHSSDDSVVIAEDTSTVAYNKLKAVGANVIYSLYDNVSIDGVTYHGHWSWIYLLKNMPKTEEGVTVMEWISNHSLPLESYSATLISEVFEYGTDITKLVIYSPILITKDSINKDTFSVYAKHWTTEENAEIDLGAYDGLRQITNAYISATETGEQSEEGHYIVLELAHGYQVPGAGMLSFSLKTWVNYLINYDYQVTQEKDFNNTENTVYKGSINVNTNNIRTLIEENFEFKTSDSGLNYRQYSPNTLSRTPSSDTYPLIIWIHGMGESGLDGNNRTQLLGNQGGIAFVDNDYIGEAYVVAPQCPTFWMTFEDEETKKSIYVDQMVSLIKQVIKENPDIDPKRIYIGGCSMGGYMTWQTIIAAPELFAAAFPICAAYTPTDEDIEKVKDIPIWLVHSTDDETVIESETTAIAYEKLKTIGADVTYSRYDSVESSGNVYNGHWSWVYLLNNQTVNKEGTTFMEWLVQQKQEIKNTEPVIPTNPEIPKTADTIKNPTVFVVSGLLALLYIVYRINEKRKIIKE